jgi:hypothetical protein
MYLDFLGRVSNAQAFGAGAVSTDSVDLGNVTPKREIGTGEVVGFGIVITTAGTVAATLFEVISATDAALTAGIKVHASLSVPLAEALAGFSTFLAFPPGTPTQRFVGIRATTAGGTVSATAWLTSQQLFSILAKSYAKGYAVTV